MRIEQVNSYMHGWRAQLLVLLLVAPLTVQATAAQEGAAEAAEPPPNPWERLDSLMRVEPERFSMYDPWAGADSTVFPPGWPTGPTPLPGSILPRHRIVAYYGNPNSRFMGILGELEPEAMLARLDEEVAAWNRADPDHPVMPALHMVTVVAQAEAGADGDYAARMSDAAIERVSGWADRRDALLFLDLQVGLSEISDYLPGLSDYLSRPNVHLGLDPEFMMKTGAPPGTRIGTMDAADINYAIRTLAEIVEEHDLPPKVLVIHRFTQNMVTNYDEIELDPRVQLVMHMDGWGRPWLKRRSYRDFIIAEPVQYTGIKVFYKNDRRNGSSLMTPQEILDLRPVPLYVQYQ